MRNDFDIPIDLEAVWRWLPRVAVAGGILWIAASSNPFRFVENGQNLVVFSWFGGIQEAPLRPGFHLVQPLTAETYPFDVKTRALSWIDGDASAYGPRLVALSQDGQEILVEITLQYRVVDPPTVFARLGSEEDYVRRIAPVVRSVLASEAAAFSAQDLYSGGRPVLQAQVRERLSQYLQQFGIATIDLLLRDVQFDPDFVKAIEQKTIAENRLAQKEFEIEQARQDARSIVAEAEAEAGKLQAKADALTRNPQYLDVVKSDIFGSTLDVLVTE